MISKGRRERQQSTLMGNEALSMNWNTVAVESANTTKERSPMAMSERVCSSNDDYARVSFEDETKVNRRDCRIREGTIQVEEQESNPKGCSEMRREEDCRTDVARATREARSECLWIWISMISLWKKIRTREGMWAPSMEMAVEEWNCTRRKFLRVWLLPGNSTDPLEWMEVDVAQLCDCSSALVGQVAWVSLESTGVDSTRSCCLRSSLDWHCDWNSYHLFRHRHHFSRESSLLISNSSRLHRWHWSTTTMEHHCHYRAACRSSSRFHRLSRGVLQVSWTNCSCSSQWALLLRKVLDVCHYVEFVRLVHVMSGCCSVATALLMGTRSLPLINNHGWNYDDDCVDYVWLDEYRIYTLRRKEKKNIDYLEFTIRSIFHKEFLSLLRSLHYFLLKCSAQVRQRVSSSRLLKNVAWNETLDDIHIPFSLFSSLLSLSVIVFVSFHSWLKKSEERERRRTAWKALLTEVEPNSVQWYWAMHRHKSCLKQITFNKSY